MFFQLFFQSDSLKHAETMYGSQSCAKVLLLSELESNKPIYINRTTLNQICPASSLQNPWRHGTVLQLAFGYAARIAGLALFLQRLVPERLFHTWLRCLMGSVLSGLFVGHILTHHSCRWLRDVQSVTMFNSIRIQNPCRTTIPTTLSLRFIYHVLHHSCLFVSVAGFLALKELPVQMHPRKPTSNTIIPSL